MAKALIVGNWKSYVATVKDAKKIFTSLEKALPKKLSVEVVVCPSHPFLTPLAERYHGQRIVFGAQDAHFEAGAATGTVSPQALKSVGARYVIVGHAERRAMGETDDVVSKKVGAVLDAKLTPIVCVGEHERDRDGNYLEALGASVTASLQRANEKDLKKLVIAYEPVWAIGAALPPSGRVIRETILYIRKVIADRFGKAAALKVRIIYGGAVEPNGAKELAAESGANGFLVGRASVDALSFVGIVGAYLK